ncbi:uncharacterized protein LOC119091641 [Pollicipes pollicipes]|uniref:uncharacterized protein LOC119091641 n=1 Tax=Pollicipes pollicipes TaxID=41117 RepID=UPI00188524FB|nr:uncharacterized protein LOC119091641 [Pollicipes pollicipes]
MEGRGSQRSVSSPGGRAGPRSRGADWRTRQYDSSSDNDDIAPDVAVQPASIVLQPAKSGDLSCRELGGYPGRGGAPYGGEMAAVRPDHLHYASKPVSSGIYQSLTRRGRRGPGHKHGSLSSSDNNSDTTTYAEGEMRSKMEALQSGLHTPPEPAPPEVPSRGPSSHQAVRSLQRLQSGYAPDTDGALPSPSGEHLQQLQPLLPRRLLQTLRSRFVT